MKSPVLYQYCIIIIAENQPGVHWISGIIAAHRLFLTVDGKATNPGWLDLGFLAFKYQNSEQAYSRCGHIYTLLIFKPRLRIQVALQCFGG